MFWLLLPIIGIIIISTLLGCCIGSNEKVDWKQLTFCIICFLIILFCLFANVYELQQKAIRNFETGKYRKEITYKIIQKDSLMIPIDSTITYKPIKD